MHPDRIDGVKHSFTALSEKFGHCKSFEDVFELFGEFEKGQNDVIFDVSWRVLAGCLRCNVCVFAFSGLRKWLNHSTGQCGFSSLQEITMPGLRSIRFHSRSP